MSLPIWKGFNLRLPRPNLLHSMKLMWIRLYNNPRPILKNDQIGKTTAHTNHNFTIIITITQDDWANNATDLLQYPHITPMFTILPLTLQYTKTLPFFAYYNNKEPLLSSILILSHIPTTTQIPTFLEQLPTILLPTCNTLPPYK